MKEDGRHSRELAEQYAYVSMKDPKISQKVAQDGLKTRELNNNSLGKILIFINKKQCFF